MTLSFNLLTDLFRDALVQLLPLAIKPRSVRLELGFAGFERSLAIKDMSTTLFFFGTSAFSLLDFSE